MFAICLIGVKRPSLSKFHRDRVHRARLFANRDFRYLVTLRRLAKWGLGPEPSDKAIAHEVTIRRSKFLPNVVLNTYFLIRLFLAYYHRSSPVRVSTMKENKGKEVVNEEDHPESQPQVLPLAGDKKRSLSKSLDLGNLPNRRGKKAKHGSS